MTESTFELRRAAQNFRDLHFFLGRVDCGVGLVRIIEERKHAVVVFVLDGIELVRVALRALDRDAKHALADRFHAVEKRLHSELLGIDAAFFVEHGVAKKAGGDAIVLRCAGQQVARDLANDKLIIGQVAIHGVDHPVAVEPDLAGLVFFKAVGIGVAGGVQPDAGPSFAVMRRGEQAVDLFLICLRAVVVDEGIDFFWRGRQADEIEAETAQKSRAVGFWRGRELISF